MSTRTKPHYLELLNTIAIQERGAGVFLKAWAEKTPDEGLRADLELVARRETSHYDVFARRIEELGFSLEDREMPEAEERRRVLGSDMSDMEKIAWRKAQMAGQKGPSIRERYVAAAADETVDALTQSFLRWFADVEADSGALLEQAYKRIEAQGG